MLKLGNAAENGAEKQIFVLKYQTGRARAQAAACSRRP